MSAGLRPLILVRGFGGPDVSDEQRNAYQGFNDGTVYPSKRGGNYIYEGFLLRALKSDRYPYRDATNVVGYYATDVTTVEPDEDWTPDAITGSIVIDPTTERKVLERGVAGTLWVYRYYDLVPRSLARYGDGLVRLIELIEKAAGRHGDAFDGVDLLAHSMGGLVVRATLSQLDTQEKGSAARRVHRVVTLGTPHRGIAFQRIPRWMLNVLPYAEKAADEIASFDPESTSFREVADWFPVRRILTVVGTNYRTYGVSAATVMNRLSNLVDQGALGYNRSDGLVKQSSAQLPGAPRTFVHKCHGGPDSLITSRESYEIAMRFFHATHRVRLWLDDAQIPRGGGWFGRSEYYFGVSIKPRYVDFELFHQSPEAENCYGPFTRSDFSDPLPDLATELSLPLAAPGDRTTGWAGPDRLIWEGWMDDGARPEEAAAGLVFRLDLFVGERDGCGIGFSDNVIVRKQFYVQIFPTRPLSLFVHTGEQYLGTRAPKTCAELAELAGEGWSADVQNPRNLRLDQTVKDGEWVLEVGGTGFDARLRLEITPENPVA